MSDRRNEVRFYHRASCLIGLGAGVAITRALGALGGALLVAAGCFLLVALTMYDVVPDRGRFLMPSNAEREALRRIAGLPPVSGFVPTAFGGRLREPATLRDAVSIARTALDAQPERPDTLPVVTTLCGSTRFPDAHMLAMAHLSMLGRIVIPLGLQGHADFPTGARFLTSDGDESTPGKQGLDELHFRKIDVSDGIYVVNVAGYVGSSTKREIAYARAHGKTVEWMFPVAAPQELRDVA